MTTLQAEVHKPLDERTAAPLHAELSSLTAQLEPAHAATVRSAFESPQFQDSTRAAFDRFDRDGNGVLDLQELPLALSYFDDAAGAALLAHMVGAQVTGAAPDAAILQRARNITAKDTDAWMRHLDVTKSGNITFAEFEYLAKLKFVTSVLTLQWVDNALTMAGYGLSAAALGVLTVVLLRRRSAAAQRAAMAAASPKNGSNGPQRLAWAAGVVAAAHSPRHDTTGR